MPYITRLHVEDCRNVKLLDVDLSVPESTGEEAPASAPQEQRAFRHLILTGPNGSGKSGVLERIASAFAFAYEEAAKDKEYIKIPDLYPNRELVWFVWDNHPTSFGFPFELATKLRNGDCFLAYCPARRAIKTQSVSGPSALTLDMETVGPRRAFSESLLQFLVNKHTERAYAIADGDTTNAERIKRWFDNLWSRIKLLMEDKDLDIQYDRNAFTFRFRRSDGYEFDLSTLADGHAAAFAILGEIFIRIEAAQRVKNDFTFEPEGVVIVDEIETHLHLSLQEQILPLLTTMFPRVQFIVATHSPAVIASIPGAVVYDLRKQQQFLSDHYRGIPYGMLMTEHFGISSDIDLDSTDKLLRFRGLARLASRTPDQEREMHALAEELSARSQVLATEVWMVKERLGTSEIQLAGE